MKSAKRWAKYHDHSGLTLEEFARAVQLDTLLHAAKLCRQSGRTEDLECAEKIESERADIVTACLLKEP